MVKRVFVLFSFVVAILVIIGNAFAHIPEPSLSSKWKFIGRDSNGTTFYFNARKITYLPKGIVEVWKLMVPRGEVRKTFVNIFKNHLLWYIKGLDKINCKTHQYAMLELTAYSFEQAVLDDESFQHEKWNYIPPGSPEGVVEKRVCNETPSSIPAQYKQTIPDPPLGPEWKFVAIGYDGATYYFNIRKITYLPGGIVKVWILKVQRGKWRRAIVNALKYDLTSEGKDPNNAERYWYVIELDKFNCKSHQTNILKNIFYSFGKTVLIQESPSLGWEDIMPGSPREKIENYVCNETPPSMPTQYKQNIPEPSLGPEWKFVGRDSNDGTTFYFNTRKITHLPNGIVKVWELLVPRGEFRRGIVNDYKKLLLFKGEDPNNAERLWYVISLEKFNCKNHQFATLELINYSLGRVVLDDESAQYEKWSDIPPGSPAEAVEKYVCK